MDGWIMKRVILAQVHSEASVLYSISADGGNESELIATLQEEVVKGKAIENVLAGVSIDIMYTVSVGV